MQHVMFTAIHSHPATNWWGSARVGPQIGASRARRSSDFDLDLGSRYTDAVAGDIVIRWRTKDLSRPDVELRTVQRADYLVASDLSLGQRPGVMCAGVVECKKFTIDVEQGNLCSLHIDQPSLAGLDLVRPCYSHKVTHGSYLSCASVQSSIRLTSSMPLLSLATAVPLV